jgi:hypothetical protein
VKNQLIDGFTPIIPDLTGAKPLYVGRGTSGKTLPHQSH